MPWDTPSTDSGPPTGVLISPTTSCLWPRWFGSQRWISATLLTNSTTALPPLAAPVIARSAPPKAAACAGMPPALSAAPWSSSLLCCSYDSGLVHCDPAGRRHSLLGGGALERRCLPLDRTRCYRRRFCPQPRVLDSLLPCEPPAAAGLAASGELDLVPRGRHPLSSRH